VFRTGGDEAISVRGNGAHVTGREIARFPKRMGAACLFAVFPWCFAVVR